MHTDNLLATGKINHLIETMLENNCFIISKFNDNENNVFETSNIILFKSLVFGVFFHYHFTIYTLNRHLFEFGELVLNCLNELCEISNIYLNTVY